MLAVLLLEELLSRLQKLGWVKLLSLRDPEVHRVETLQFISYAHDGPRRASLMARQLSPRGDLGPQVAPLSPGTLLFSSSNLRKQKEVRPLIKSSAPGCGHRTPVHTPLARSSHVATPSLTGSWEMQSLAKKPLLSPRRAVGIAGCKSLSCGAVLCMVGCWVASSTSIS